MLPGPILEFPEKHRHVPRRNLTGKPRRVLDRPALAPFFVNNLFVRFRDDDETDVLSDPTDMIWWVDLQPSMAAKLLEPTCCCFAASRARGVWAARGLARDSLIPFESRGRIREMGRGNRVPGRWVDSCHITSHQMTIYR